MAEVENEFKLSSQKPVHILLVEDNAIALHIAEALVSQAGCSYVSVADGEQALVEAQSIDFDLIITDIGLPGISGIEFTRLIREWEEFTEKKTVPIIGLTAHLLGDTEYQSLHAGMNKVLLKPIYLHTLRELIARFVKPNRLIKTPQGQNLGRDLPYSENELFDLKKFPLFDREQGIKHVPDFSTLKDLLLIMVSQAIPEDLAALRVAYLDKNWQQIESLAHKMKSGALYCGTIRMKYACQYFERYCKAGHAKCLDALYNQLIEVVEETKVYIEAWLPEYKKFY